MISLSKLISGEATVSRHLTYEGDSSFIPESLKKFASSFHPIVVWNLTNRCNLKCLHCYASAGSESYELTTEQCFEVIDKLSNFKVPLILFSGGEPLLRADIFDIAEYAKKKKIRTVLSTNGTLIDKDVAENLEVFEYVGVSLDGLKGINDRFRGVNGAFEKAFKGLLIASEVVLSGIRFTVTRHNYNEVLPLIKLARENGIPRFCLYHLVPSGRADFEDDINNSERRKLIDDLITEAVVEGMEIMTVDNPADGIYTYLRLKQMNEDRAEMVLEFLKYRGGDSSGTRLACIDHRGDVHPNQFWWDYTVGNVLEKDFEEIWMRDDELLRKLRNKIEYLRGKCGRCRFKTLCGGFRVRAYRYGDLWGEDPSCYLTEEEIQ
ncbi:MULTISPECIES: radical SAM/SPASM domain-containing protein [unclassified Archaeoglobus]|uniref:radical SAM/SPASM domain-containing protein n=1 Tax=unclassified Archaeoglobus TaxID=2643606 RepID=UPI0025C53127|nr:MULTISPECIES: radical SAM protein [unclassified Archaeoglobus]